MSKKKKIIIIALAVVFTLIGGKFIYHATMSIEKKAEKITAKFEKKLKLSEEQTAKVYEINLQMFKKIETAKKDEQNKSHKEIKDTMQKEWFTQIKEVLNAEQVKILEDKFNKKCNKS